MNRRLHKIAANAILGIAAFAAAGSASSVAAQGTWTGRPGAHPAGQGKPTGAPPPRASGPTTPAAPASPYTAGRKTATGEQFFIVASVDLQKSQLLLKYPTEVTLLVLVNDATKFTDESGKPLKLSDFRAGDTVWMVSSLGSSGEETGLRIRKGRMTVADLHRYYLDYAEIK